MPAVRWEWMAMIKLWRAFQIWLNPKCDFCFGAGKLKYGWGEIECPGCEGTGWK